MTYREESVSPTIYLKYFICIWTSIKPYSSKLVKNDVTDNKIIKLLIKDA